MQVPCHPNTTELIEKTGFYAEKWERTGVSVGKNCHFQPPFMVPKIRIAF
jgi:hypothetical protein